MSKDFIDFAAIKEAVSFEKAVEYLGLEMTRHGQQYRGECPTCDTDNPRALVITPAKGFYCFGDKRGGDVVGLVAHCKGIGQREAAQMMQRDLMGNSTRTVQNRTSSRGKRTQEEPQARQNDSGMQALDHLDPTHEAVLELGMSPHEAERIGAGYAPRGVLRGLVAFPLRTEDGVLVGYVGCAEGRVGKLHFPEQKVVPLHKKRA